MGLIEQARTKATENQTASQAAAAEAELNRTVAATRELSLDTGFKAASSDLIEVAVSGYRIRDSWGGGSTYPPEMKTARLYVIEDVRIVEHVQVRHSRFERGLVRQCSTCHRQSVTQLSITTNKTWSWNGNVATDEKKQEGFVESLARALALPSQCTFCQAAAEAASCPTCHRGWER